MCRWCPANGDAMSILTMRPAPCLVAVKQAVDELLPWYSSVHRGAGYKSLLATDAYEDAREAVRLFVGGRGDDAVVFTRNTTDALNLLAAALTPDTEAASETMLLDLARDRLTAVPGVQQYQTWAPGHPRIAVLPFTLSSVPYAQLAVVLSAEYGIGIRHGCFCAHPLMAHLLGVTPTLSEDLRRGMKGGTPTIVPGAVRASAGLGTTAADVDRLVEALTTIVIDGPHWTYRCSPDGTDCWPDPDPRPHWTNHLHRR